jgi:hypothetical protein
MNTPKQKAEELVNKYMNIGQVKMSDYSRIYQPTAKVCALIAVDEVLDYLNKIMIPNPFGQYWDEVRKEVENL